MNIPHTNNYVKIAIRERPVCQNAIFDVHVNCRNSNIVVIGDRSFHFDYVLGPEVTQENLYQRIAKPLVLKFIEGYHCTALAYGQTGTGKSYSMGLNDINSEQENVGIIPRCLDELFDLINNIATNVYVSFVEIYNEKVFDILSNNPEKPINTKGFKFNGGLKKEIFNAHDGYDLLVQGMKNRHVRPTKMNQQSSRSHAIFTIYLTKFMETQIVSSSLNLVDLAGSEGVRRTGHEGVALAEGVNINQGLLSIGKVLQALSAGRKVIPYRDSILSSVLQDSLTRNSYFTLLACVSPLSCDNNETLSTIRFAQNAKSLKNNPQISSLSMVIQKSVPKRSINVKTPIVRKLLHNYVGTEKSVQKNKTINHSYFTPVHTKKKILDSIYTSNAPVQNSEFSNFPVSTNSSMNSSKDTNYLKSSEKIFASTSDNPTLSYPWHSIKMELKDIIRNEIMLLTEQQEKEIKDHPVECTQQLNNLLYNLMSNDSLFKVPSLLQNNLRKDSLSNTEAKSTAFQNTKISSESSFVRRSLRLSSIGKKNEIKNSEEEKRHVTEIHPLRRSIRISILNNTSENVNKDNSCNYNQMKKTISKEKKLTIKSQITNNDFINEYFNNDTNKLKGTKAEHEKAIFQLLNNGSINELKILPEIGLKTAYQLITYRTLNGKFRNFNAIGKLPVWKGKAWDRFKKNMIILKIVHPLNKSKQNNYVIKYYNNNNNKILSKKKLFFI